MVYYIYLNAGGKENVLNTLQCLEIVLSGSCITFGNSIDVTALARTKIQRTKQDSHRDCFSYILRNYGLMLNKSCSNMSGNMSNLKRIILLQNHASSH